MTKSLFLLLIMTAASATVRASAPTVQTHDPYNETVALLDSLRPDEKHVGSNITIVSPSSDTQQDVRDKLVKLANESPESRPQVIAALIAVLEDPTSKSEGIIAERWTAAVNVLGELKATEAIDVLVKNLDQTGQNGIVISIHYSPVLSAVIKIGEPAVDALIDALSDESLKMRTEAAEALARIGQPGFARVEAALYRGSPTAKGAAGLALAWMGGDDAKSAIERALATETDPKAQNELKDALKEMRRRWGK